MHVRQPNDRDKRVVNYIEHGVHPIAIIAPWRRVAALFVRVAIPAIIVSIIFSFVVIMNAKSSAPLVICAARL
jgi:hypothetical protein